MRALPTSCEESERWFACRKCAMRPLSVSARLPPVYSIDASTKCIAGVIMMYMAVATANVQTLNALQGIILTRLCLVLTCLAESRRQAETLSTMSSFCEADHDCGDPRACSAHLYTYSATKRCSRL